MSGLALVAAIAAQAAAQTGAPPSPSAPPGGETPAPLRITGESTYVDLEAGAGYATNPFLRVGSSGGSVSGTISVRAVHTKVTDRTTTVVSAFGQSVFYGNGYKSAQSFDLNGRHDAAVNEKLRLFADGDIAYDKGGQLDTRILGIPNVPLLPGTTLPPPLLGPGNDFLAVSGKTYRASADVGGQLALGTRDFLNFTAGIDHSTFKEGSIDTRYTTIPISIGYDRQLSERATVGARVAAQFSHYSGDIASGAGRNFHVITPEVTAQLTLSERLTFSGDIGASFSSTDEPTGTRQRSGLAADASLCSSSERTQFCGRVSVQQQAATSAGPTRVISASLDYSRQLSADETIAFSLSGNRYSNPILVVMAPTFSHATYVRVAADYSRRFGNRWFAGLDLAARKLTEGSSSPDADFSATLFIRYRFGDLK